MSDDQALLETPTAYPEVSHKDLHKRAKLNTQLNQPSVPTLAEEDVYSGRSRFAAALNKIKLEVVQCIVL